MPEAQTQPTKFEAFVATVKGGGGRWYFEEFLLRGEPSDQPGGRTKGAHVILGAVFPDPMGGPDIVRTSQAIPVGDLPGGVALPEILPVGQVAMQREIDALKADVASLKADAATAAKAAEQSAASAVKALNDAADLLASMTAERDALAAKIAKAREDLA